MAEIFVNKGNGVAKSGFGNAEKLVENVGFLPSDFGSFRKWCFEIHILFKINC